MRHRIDAGFSSFPSRQGMGIMHPGVMDTFFYSGDA